MPDPGGLRGEDDVGDEGDRAVDLYQAAGRRVAIARVAIALDKQRA
jgi:hypothetical protein